MRHPQSFWSWLFLLVSCVALAAASFGHTFAQAQRIAEPPTSTQVAEIPDRRPAPLLSFRSADSLERPEREAQEHPDELIRAMALKPGDVVADVGCGTGFLARRIAKIVAPTGKVYCQDIQPEMLDLMKQRAEAEGVTGIVPVLGSTDDPKLPKGGIDWLLLVDAYHEFDNGPEMLRQMRVTLSPRGKVALVEARAEDNSASYVSPTHRMSVRQVLAEWKPAGYRLLDLSESLPSQHLFIFEPDDRPAGAPVAANLALAEAVRVGAAEAQPQGADERSVTIRLRRKSKNRLVVTMAAGEYFASPLGQTRDMVAVRDAAVALFDDEWHDLHVLAAGIPVNKDAPQATNALELRPERARPLRALMYSMQATGMPFIVAQALLAIAVEDRSYEEIEPLLQGGPISAPHAVALAMRSAARAGTDVASKKIMAARERLAAAVPEETLRQWLTALGP